MFGWQGCQLGCGAGLPLCSSYLNVGQTSYIYTMYFNVKILNQFYFLMNSGWAATAACLTTLTSPRPSPCRTRKENKAELFILAR